MAHSQPFKSVNRTSTPCKSASCFAVLASLGCTEINIDRELLEESGGTSSGANGGQNNGAGGSGPGGSGPGGSGPGSSGGRGGTGGGMPSVVLPPPVDPILDQEGSLYEEIEAEIEAMGVADANGHISQVKLAEWAAAPGGFTEEQKEFLFDMGDEMTEFKYTPEDGVGSLLGANGMPIPRFNRAPNGGRFTGPNARACIDCHDVPLGNAGGDNVNNVLQDPEPNLPSTFNLRNTRNINGDAWIELAAIEMTIDLQTRLAACKATAQGGQAQTTMLESKGVTFGSVTCQLQAGQVRVNYANIQGISPDLVVRPQGWKGNVPTFRAFGEDAAFGEMGMLSDRFAYVAMGMPLPSAELGAFAIPDVDGDGVTHEMSVGDITAIQFYFAAQSRPTTLQALQAENAALLTRPLTADETALIAHGDTVFNGLGCSNCHVRALGVIDSVFRIPDERHPAFRDAELQGTPNGYDTGAQIRLDLARDSVVETPHLTATGGVYQVPAMTDLKRHFLGNHLCDGAKRSTPVDSSFRSIQVPADSLTSNLPLQIDSCHFLTADLWGIGQTSPYMHDGRAATLREAIAMHCSATGQPVSEADLSCRQFAMAPEADQTALIGFLMSQVFRPDDPPPPEP